jgi:hypothetical protein
MEEKDGDPAKNSPRINSIRITKWEWVEEELECKYSISQNPEIILLLLANAELLFAGGNKQVLNHDTVHHYRRNSLSRERREN